MSLPISRVRQSSQYGTHTLCRNVGKKLPFYAALSPKRAQNSITQGPKTEIKISVFSKRPDLLQDPHSLLFNKCPGSFPRVKRPQLQADHTPPSSAEVKNEWSYQSIFIHAFTAWTAENSTFMEYCLNTSA
jgi:hypothetical protein